MRSRQLKRKPNKGKIRNATALKYYGIQFKSKLELYTYKKLKEANIKFEYEKYRFSLLDRFEFNGKSMELMKKQGQKVFDWQKPTVRGITYLPDFANLKNKWVIECKGHPNDSFPLKWKLFKKFMNITHPDFTLYMPRNQKHIDIVIEHIKNNERLLQSKSNK